MINFRRIIFAKFCFVSLQATCNNGNVSTAHNGQVRWSEIFIVTCRLWAAQGELINSPQQRIRFEGKLEMSSLSKQDETSSLPLVKKYKDTSEDRDHIASKSDN